MRSNASDLAGLPARGYRDDANHRDWWTWIVDFCLQHLYADATIRNLDARAVSRGLDRRLDFPPGLVGQPARSHLLQEAAEGRSATDQGDARRGSRAEEAPRRSTTADDSEPVFEGLGVVVGIERCKIRNEKCKMCRSVCIFHFSLRYFQST